MSALLLYDADCGFCRWSAQRILRWDRRGNLRAVAIQSSEGQNRLSIVPPEKRLDSWHVITGDGIYSAGAAVAPLAKLLPLGAPVALLARKMPRTTERAYRWVARNRERLGKRLGENACSVDPAGRKAGP